MSDLKPYTHKFHFIAILSIMALGISVASCGNPKNKKADIPQNELNELEAVIRSAPMYEHDVEAHLDSLRDAYQHASDTHRKFELSLNLSDDYRRFNTDSALHYAMICVHLSEDGTPEMQHKSAIARVNALSTAGLFSEAIPIFDALYSNGLEEEQHTAYWLAGRTLYSYLSAYVGEGDIYYNVYNKRYLQYDDSLLTHLPAGNNFRKFIECERMVTNGQITRAGENLAKLLKTLNPQSNLYGMTAFQMANVYKAKGDETQYAAYLAKAAICDIKCGVREGMALPTLSKWLYDNNHFAEAFSFVNFSLEDAMKGNVRMRTISIAQMVPMIDGAYREKINSSRDELMAYFLIAALLFALSASLIVVLTRSIRRREENERKLAALSKIQETYIGNFIGLCSNYADRLDQLSKTVSRKLNAGQADDLLKLVNSGKFADYGNEKFFATFDHAFLDIYPDFIDKINTLLRPEEKISVSLPHTLTPELRIYAFVRLGVTESTRIAQILHYSVSTVYAYRNRMRNKAIDRENFDKNIAGSQQSDI